MHLSEILTHFGEERHQYFNAISPPVIQTSNFAFKNFKDFKAAFDDELKNSIYTRGNNPTVNILRKKLAALEKAEDSLVFASGVAAISAAVMANVKAGDHVLCVDAPYAWTFKLMTNYMPRFNVTNSFFQGNNLDDLKRKIQPNTSVIYLESPNSLLMELQDLEEIAAIAKENGIVTIIDNSCASPYFQNPIELGIDIVVHSGTKFINGHSDVVCGVLCSSKAMVKKVFESELMNIGGIISPHNAALIIRGLRTLELRMERSYKSALKIVEWLEAHPKVEKVYYPFSKNFAQLELAKKQMKGAGGLFSVQFKTKNIENIERFSNAIQKFLLAVSWGGHESLLLPVAAFYNRKGYKDPEAPWNIVRLYIGFEDPDYLIRDLAQAMKHL